ECVQIRDERGAVVADWSFKSPVRLLHWTREGLLAGEAGRIHLLNASAPDAVSTIQLQTGHVTDAALAPDGAWANSAAAKTPRLILPQSVAFRGEAVGQEVKALPIQPPPIAGRWLIEYDRTLAPWLVIHPTTGTGPAVVYMGVDPVWYRPGSVEQVLLHVQLALSPRGLPAEGTETAVEVRLLPEESMDVQRVLWVWGDGNAASFRDQSDPRGLRALAEILAGPPHYLAHKEITGNVQEPLDPYAVVVLSAEAAARGLIARRAVLDYVQNGGALLFLGGRLAEGTERELSQWLAPAGIQISAGVLVEGTFSVVGGHWLTRHWPQVKIAGGCGIYTDDPATVRVPGDPSGPGNSCVFMTRTYGRGRVAALASQSVLESNVVDTPEGQLFAGDLFRWLAGADKYLENQDMDSDGLPDDIEDANGNGLTEPNETNFLERDSDQDGLPDGIEDSNPNGLPDEGETDPLNPDSDGDGIQDGADESPAPPAGAPVLHVIAPAQGPAEGGTTVIISGRNLPADAAVWFADRPSPSVRVVDTTELIAETPAFRDARGGQAPVRIQSRSGDLQGALPHGFSYTPRSTVRLALESVDQTHVADSTYEGRLVVRLEKPPEAVLENVTLVLAPDPPNSIQWPRQVASGPQRSQPVIRLLQSGELLIAVLNAQSLAGAGQLAAIPWGADIVHAKLPAVRIKHALVYARNGQTLHAQTSDLALQLK
ncbi:MAG: IPT/TIG domain-containing protein, partial [Candidatus Hydrogenedentes bacterium]|nr:IPT/TIG domain-containing protein [Candidatus Hydrogenedentota bacterium]